MSAIDPMDILKGEELTINWDIYDHSGLDLAARMS